MSYVVTVNRDTNSREFVTNAGKLTEDYCYAGKFSKKADALLLAKSYRRQAVASGMYPGLVYVCKDYGLVSQFHEEVRAANG